MNFLNELVLAQDKTISISKVVMLIGSTVAGTILIFADTIFNQRLDVYSFSIYIGATVGANSVNKAIAVSKDIKTNLPNNNISAK